MLLLLLARGLTLASASASSTKFRAANARPIRQPSSAWAIGDAWPSKSGVLRVFTEPSSAMAIGAVPMRVPYSSKALILVPGLSPPDSMRWPLLNTTKRSPSRTSTRALRAEMTDSPLGSVTATKTSLAVSPAALFLSMKKTRVPLADS